MIYYRYLDLDYKTSANKLLQYIQEQRPDLLKKDELLWKNVDTYDVLAKVPELPQMFESLNISIRFLAFFVSFDPITVLHIDTKYSKARINLPILNCENTETRFYTMPTDSRQLSFQKNGVPFYKLDTTKCEWVDQFYLTQPVVFRNNQPHNVISNNPLTPRVSCTIGFNEDISYLLV